MTISDQFVDLRTTERIIRACAEHVGVCVVLGKVEGRRLHFTLALDGERFRRMNATGKRRVNGVCWHGHREFFRAVYRRMPQARIRSSFALYTDAEQFERTHVSQTEAKGNRLWPAVLSCTCNGMTSW